MKYSGFLGFFFFMCFFWVFGSVANPEDMIDGQDERIIHIHRKTSSPLTNEMRNLIVPSDLEDIESLAINPNTKQWMLLRDGKDPLELEGVFQPSLPWDLSHDHLVQFVSAHNFFLKQLNDGTYKIETKVPGLGGGRGVSLISNIVKRVLKGKPQKVLPPAKPIQQIPANNNILTQKQAKAETKAAQKIAKRAPKPRGVNNPATKKALDVGNQKHKEFADATRHLHIDKPLKDAQQRILRPDLQTEKMVHELKPGTVSGVKKGLKQLQRYQDASGKKGFLHLYDVPGNKTPLDQIMKKSFPKDPIVKKINKEPFEKTFRDFWKKNVSSSQQNRQFHTALRANYSCQLSCAALEAERYYPLDSDYDPVYDAWANYGIILQHAVDEFKWGHLSAPEFEETLLDTRLISNPSYSHLAYPFTVDTPGRMNVKVPFTLDLESGKVSVGLWRGEQLLRESVFTPGSYTSTLETFLEEKTDVRFAILPLEGSAKYVLKDTYVFLKDDFTLQHAVEEFKWGYLSIGDFNEALLDTGLVSNPSYSHLAYPFTVDTPGRMNVKVPFTLDVESGKVSVGLWRGEQLLRESVFTPGSYASSLETFLEEKTDVRFAILPLEGSAKYVLKDMYVFLKDDFTLQHAVDEFKWGYLSIVDFNEALLNTGLISNPSYSHLAYPFTIDTPGRMNVKVPFTLDVESGKVSVGLWRGEQLLRENVFTPGSYTSTLETFLEEKTNVRFAILPLEGSAKYVLKNMYVFLKED